MLKGSTKSPAKRVPRAEASAPVQANVVPSLPPAPADGLRTSPNLEHKLPKTSLVRKKALAIIGLRARGYTTEEIAQELQIKPNSVYSYLWRAGRAGLLSKKDHSLLDNPTERIEYELTHKAVDNLAEMLNSDQILERGQKSVKMEATFEMAKGVLFEKFRKVPEQAPQTMNALKIEIVMPTSGQNEARAGSIGGTPMNFIEGEKV